jgi:hypothetical protein
MITNPLEKLSDDEVAENLEVYQKEKERRDAMKVPPKMKENPDFSKVIEVVKFNVEQIIKNGYEDEDFPSYLEEAVIKALYDDPIAYNAWHRFFEDDR